MTSSTSRLGAQLWIERDDSAEHIDGVISTAASLGLTELRIFLMWPWMQPEPHGAFDFRLYDVVFDRAQAHGMRVKATLTANSGPWWAGAPGVLHTFTLTLDEGDRRAMAAYIEAAVSRYRHHPALGQWILWNEPINPVAGKDGPPQRTIEARRAWVEVLAARYPDIRALNARWHTGFAGFEEVPFAEQVPSAAHADTMWRSYAPRLADFDLRELVLRRELAWIADRVRELDPATPVAANPNGLFGNHADAGYRLIRLAETVDTLGASFHAPWSFSYARREDHLALIAAGVGLLAAIPGRHGVEVTEMQLGNTFYAGERPIGITRRQVAASFVATRLAGAESSTGWLLNTRRQDFEAGEWGLLDDDDAIGDRALGARDAATALEALAGAVGPWQAAEPDVLVLVDEDSEAIELVSTMFDDVHAGRGPQVGIAGSTLVAVQLMNLGMRVRLAPASALRSSDARVIVVSHVVAWTAEFAAELADAAERGVTVLVDATSGEFDPDGALHRPWPGGLAERIGLRNGGLDSPADGAGSWSITAERVAAGSAGVVRSTPRISDRAWRPVAGLSFGADDSPVLWRRELGAGVLLSARFGLAIAALGGDGQSALRVALRTATAALAPALTPRGDHVFVLEVVGERGRAWGVFAGDGADAPAVRLVLDAEPGDYLDLVTGIAHPVGPDGRLVVVTAAGWALLVTR